MSKKIRPWVPALFEVNEKGERKLVTDRYRLIVYKPRNGKLVKDKASEWGAIGELKDIIAEASDNGRHRVTIQMKISKRDDRKGWRLDPDATDPDGNSDIRYDVNSVLSAVVTLAETMGYFTREE